MRQNNRVNPQLAKKIARQKYKERQIDKYIKWSIEARGYVKYKDIVEQQSKYKINIEYIIELDG
jgi:hypothetical protein